MPRFRQGSLSWLQVEQRQATIDPYDRAAFARGLRFLLEFRQLVRDQLIPHWGAAKRVLVLGTFSRQFYTCTLRSLLTLDHVPLAVRIPVPASYFYGGRLDFSLCGEPVIDYPFEIVLENRRGRGRPRRESIAPTDEYFDSP